MTQNKKLRVLAIKSDSTGVGGFRSVWPHIALENNYPDEFHVDIDFYNPSMNDENFLKQYDIIHYHRSFGNFEQMEEMNKTFKRLNIVTIMDIDDYWAPSYEHPAYALIKNSGMDKHIMNNIRLAANLTTTTSIFADEISKLNKNVFVLPNAIDTTEKQFIPNPEPSDRIRIGWLGGSSHLHDLNILEGVVSKLRSDDLMDKIQFVVCGFDLRGTHTTINEQTKEQTHRNIKPMESVWYLYEKIFTDNYKIVSPEYKEFLLKFKREEYPNVKNEPYRRVWTQPISTYATNYNLFDVSLAPIKEVKFNYVKSQLKVIEAGFHKKAIIAQNYGPYQIDLENAIEYGGGINTSGNAILVDSTRNHKDWYKAIKKLVTNPELIKQLGNNLYDTVKDTYSMDKVTEDRRNLYHKLIAELKEKTVLEPAIIETK